MRTVVSLQQFITVVPTCVETDSPGQVWHLFQQSGCDLLMVLDQQLKPQGVLTLRQLLLHYSIADLAQSMPAPSSERFNCTLEPIFSIPDHWRVTEFQAYLPRIEQNHWALVNRQGHYVGLLDRLQLLQFLAVQKLPAAEPAEPMHDSPLPALGNPCATASSPIASDPIAPNSIAPDPNSSQLLLIDPLIDLLERMPIPLMLQTATGRVITQNLIWRQQVGELRDPGQIRREAALILESTPWEDPYATSDPLAADLDDTARSTTSYTSLFSHESAGKAGNLLAEVIRHTGSCHIGTEPNACVCVCPMKTGQERVWKFLKVPMGLTTAAAQTPEQVVAALPPDSSTTPLQFKLATLGFMPDPAWRSLAQTEFLWLVLAQDMTEQYQITKELAAKNADLVQLNRLKDEFLSCISHELKTPLTAVLGLSSLLKDHMLGELNERQSRYARLIYQSGRHLILIVNDMLDLTRIETGQLELTLGSVTIESVCLEAYNQAQQSHVREDGGSSLAASEAPSFRLEIQPGLSKIVADELRLRQMLGNLLSNALKFTEPEGEIGLRVEQWDGWVAFTVWDTGIGIPAEKQHLIFQKFQQLETPLTRQFEGTGLGLVLTQRLARLHGGDVTFTSIEGEGSQFTLLLPPTPPQAPPELNPDRLPVSRTPAITAENRLVLIVETTPKRIEELSHLLIHLGYRIAIARSGTEALEKSRRLQPGVVFLAPMLPMLSGWDVLTLLKADETTRHIPVVVTASRGDRAQAYQSGANFLLNVPIQPEALQQCLDRFMHQSGEDNTRSANLTVLYLHCAAQPDLNSSQLPSNSPLQDLNALLHPYHCRVLEVDDLEQADLLARVWKPHVTLINGTFADPFGEMQQFSQSPALVRLPLVTLTPEITHAANLVPGLMVFPCLSGSSIAEPQDSFDVSALWQTIQMAVGIHWTPHILIADMAMLEETWTADTPSDLSPRIQSVKAASIGGIQALIHYLQIAGYRCSMGQTWQEVIQQLEHRSVDLLLFCIHTPGSLHLFLEIVQALEQLETKPPIVVWNCPVRLSESAKSHDLIHSADSLQPSEPDLSANIATMWGTIADQILPHHISMPELLAQINQILSDR